MQENQNIHPSQSLWASPNILVKKKDGALRFCMDYRHLNAHNTWDAYPLPGIENSLAVLGHAHYFCTLDQASGYWQSPIAPEDQEKMAFVIPWDCMSFFKCHSG